MGYMANPKLGRQHVADMALATMKALQLGRGKMG